eukprot:6529678-Alexandrium_andersonii.AAC.1
MQFHGLFGALHWFRTACVRLKLLETTSLGVLGLLEVRRCVHLKLLETTSLGVLRVWRFVVGGLAPL